MIIPHLYQQINFHITRKKLEIPYNTNWIFLGKMSKNYIQNYNRNLETSFSASAMDFKAY